MSRCWLRVVVNGQPCGHVPDQSRPDLSTQVSRPRGGSIPSTSASGSRTAIETVPEQLRSGSLETNHTGEQGSANRVWKPARLITNKSTGL